MSSSLLLALLILIAGLGTDAAVGSGIDILVVPDKWEYVVGEPIQLRVTMVNTSGATVRVPHLDMLDRHYMRFMYHEITDPTGRTERLKSVRIFEQLLLGNGYKGAPLAHGDTIQVFLHPNVVNVRATASGQDEAMAGRYAFPTAGAYEVRVVYAAWPKLYNLYQGVWRSEAITITLRDALPLEKTILDAMWHSMLEGESGIDWVVRDLDRLSSVIAAHPQNPLIRHVRFALGRGYYQLALGGDKSRAADAIETLRDLSRDTPLFRREQIQRLLGRAYLENGEREKGTDTLMSLMASDPLLWTTPEFVEALTIIGIREFSVSTQWRDRESSIGAKPMSREEFLTKFQDH